jgi:hypothetical protein
MIPDALGGQVENLRDELLPERKAEDPDAPRMPFKTSYVLTRVQEDAFVEMALARIVQLEGQLGREFKEDDSTGKGQWSFGRPIKNPNSFMGKREKYTRRYYNHVEDRAVPDTVYAESNLTLSLSQRITMQMIASAINFFFGQPDDIDWFSSSAVGAEDDTLSDKIKKHSRWKVDQCGVKHKFIDGIEFAFVRGEIVMKVTHQTRSQVFKRTSTILLVQVNDPLAAKALAAGMEPENGLVPGLDANGDYICQGDATIDEMGPPPAPGIIQRLKTFFTGPEPGGNAQPPPGTGAMADGTQQTPNTQPPTPNPESNQEPTAPQMVPTGNKILKRDGVTVMPADPIWETKLITRNLVTFEGPEAAVVYYKDFIFPENAVDIQTADLIAHLYDMNVMQVAQMFRGQYGEGDAAIADMTAAVERLRAMMNESSAPKAAAGQPRTEFKETDTTGAIGVPAAEIAECWATYDADGDGVQEEIMLVLDRRNKVPIYYEYLANVTVKGARPFRIWRPMPVDGRAYGMGSMELFDPEQEFIDLQINRHNFRTSNAGITTFWNGAATVEGNRDSNLKLNIGHAYTKRDISTKAEDILSFVELPTDANALEYLIDLFMQAMQTKGGKLNSADQEMAGLPSNKLATGINEIHESGEELFSRMLAHLFPGVKGSLGDVIDVIYANMNKPEVFRFFNGEANEILSLDPEEVRDLALDVTLELSRTQQRKATQYGDLTTQLITWFYGLPFVIQQRAANYARQQLKGYGIAQADKIIDPVDLSQGQAKVAESLNYKDAPPDIRRQIESQAGLQPSTAPTATAQTSVGEEPAPAKPDGPPGPAV